MADAAARARAALVTASEVGQPRVLFSAHGLPKKIVESGDPYQWQVEQTAAAIAAALDVHGLDWQVCYQSRVGPLEWIGPSTDDEIVRAGQEGKPVVIVPIAFVSEHSETLVELDIEYARVARENGVPVYIRVATVATGTAFINGLAHMVHVALSDKRPVCSQGGDRICPAEQGRCLQAERSFKAGENP